MPRLVATPSRALAGAILLAIALFAGVRRVATIESIALAALLWALGSLAFWLYLRGEESRLARELRVARAGTEVQRRIALRRRAPPPMFLFLLFWYATVRLLGAIASTRLGYAAMLLADGDAVAASRALGPRLPWTRGGPLGELRAVVDADLTRARGTEEALGEAIRALYGMRPLAHRESERYRVHVLVKALLEQADGATARSLAEDLAASDDDEVRVYAVWLRAWFDLENLATPTEPDVRRALLLARTHGAEELVKRLKRALGEEPGPPGAAGVAPAPADG